MHLIVTQDGATPVTPPDSSSRYVSIAYLSSLGIDPNSISATAASDANTLYGVINTNPWINQSDMSAWAIANWNPNPIDRLNVALALLQQSQLIAVIGA